MGLFLQDLKSRISYNDRESISHNIMWGYPLPIMRVMKKVDPHRI
jgi:hypothetical protein